MGSGRWGKYLSRIRSSTKMGNGMGLNKVGKKV
jgi:hypothetical protein